MLLVTTVEEALSLVYAQTMQYGLQVVGGVALLMAGWMISGWASRSLRRLATRIPSLDPTVAGFLASLVRYGILALVGVAVLNQFGVQTASLIAVFGAAGLAIGLALQGTLSNLAAGVMLLLFRSFSVGDEIDAAGQRGIVLELSLFTTILIAADGTRLIVPNGKVWGDLIRNRTIDDRRRLLVSFKVINEEGIDAYAQAAIEVATGTPAILADPSPTVAVTQIDADGAILELRAWCVASQGNAAASALAWEMARMLARRRKLPPSAAKAA
jgi:small conductance mechanosensitive channel